MRFFLNSTQIFITTLILIGLWIFSSFIFFLICSLFIFFYLFLFRRFSPSYREDFVLKDGIFYSPVNGRVSYIRNNVSRNGSSELFHEIGIVSSWWKEGGMYLPIRSEVINLSFFEGKSIFRYFGKAYEKAREETNRLSIEFRCTNGDTYHLDSLKCPAGLWPKVRVVPGDRGKAQVNFGFFGLGGTTVLYLPQNYEILVKDGLEAVAGQTIMASLNDEVIKEDK
jgi:hypothetical protein